jgi:hypothetical protein
MAKPILFMVHGMGKHPAGWSGEIKQKITQVGNRYESVDGDLAAQLDLREITYDSIFEAQLQRLDQDVAALKGSALFPAVQGAVDWLAGAPEGGFTWTHVADVVFYLSRHVRNAVVATVAAEMARVISEKNDGSTEFNILAHSLGTSVAAEAVAALAQPIPQVGWAGLPPGFRFNVVMMVANVSRLLQRAEAKAYTSPMLPLTDSEGRVATNYFNFAHRFDPIPWVRRFDFQSPAAAGYGSFTNLEHFYEKNLHSLPHYLEHPLVHGFIVRMPRTANLHHATWKKAVDEYFDGTKKQFGGAFTTLAQVQAHRDAIQSRTPSHPEDEALLIPNLRTVLDTVEAVFRP